MIVPTCNLGPNRELPTTTARVQIETNERKIESTAQVSVERTLLISSHHSFA
jgi:hypothetical protein